MLPAGNLANKIGRKATIILGLVLIIVPFLVACFIKTPWLFYIAFAFAGAGWAIINVVSYPMVVEFASEKNLAKFTSQYYFFKTLAYCFAPILSSIFITHRGYSVLFIYATVVMLIAIICFAFYRKPNKIINDQSNTKQGSEKQVNKK
jgi:MFS family permease